MGFLTVYHFFPILLLQPFMPHSSFVAPPPSSVCLPFRSSLFLTSYISLSFYFSHSFSFLSDIIYLYTYLFIQAIYSVSLLASPIYIYFLFRWGISFFSPLSSTLLVSLLPLFRYSVFHVFLSSFAIMAFSGYNNIRNEALGLQEESF